jgi:uncharacterized protein YbjT (DUF2867 family)
LRCPREVGARWGTGAMKVLVTGATGYIGGRLVPRLLEQGHEVHVLVRSPERIRGRPWADRVHVHAGNANDSAAVEGALRGMDAAYYLIHSMDAGSDFAERDRVAARNFAAAGAAGDLRHVIYLGGLMPTDGAPSPHLESRAEVGEILAATLPTTEFRAGPIIGSGSASFEMIRYLTERLPMMIAPRWILNEVQPIAIRDVLSYLMAALEVGPSGVVEIGADRLSFRQTMLAYAEVRGLRRVVAPVPVFAPGLAARWVGLVTPIPNQLAVPLVEGILHPLVADTLAAERLFPGIHPISYREAVQRALQRTEQREVPTRWSGSLGGREMSYRFTDDEGLMREVRSLHIDAPPAQVYDAFARLGGDTGWLVWEWGWELRGLIDRIVGGPGLRRGRRHPTELLVGEAVDFWRVELAEPPRRLRLRAEMKVPGEAWLEWSAVPENGGTRLVQTASFAPHGLAGTLYWYMLYPVHRFIFSDLVEAVGAAALPTDASGSRGGGASGKRKESRRASRATPPSHLP